MLYNLCVPLRCQTWLRSTVTEQQQQQQQREARSQISNIAQPGTQQGGEGGGVGIVIENWGRERGLFIAVVLSPLSLPPTASLTFSLRRLALICPDTGGFSGLSLLLAGRVGYLSVASCRGDLGAGDCLIAGYFRGRD